MVRNHEITTLGYVLASRLGLKILRAHWGFVSVR